MALDGFDKLVAAGLSLQNAQEPTKAHTEFNRWVSSVTDWLNDIFPNTGIAADWASQGASNLVVGGGYYDDAGSWLIFRSTVDQRLRWLGRVPLKLKMKNLAEPALTQNASKQQGRKEIKLSTTSRAYVDPDRINDLKTLSNSQFDYSKLVRLCEELNICFAGECYLAMTMLTRSILDHVPPIFSVTTFSQIGNNYSGSKSFKGAMQNLENSSRKIADYYLHSQIRSSESLPNATQIDFSNNLDLLLAEILRVSK